MIQFESVIVTNTPTETTLDLYLNFDGEFVQAHAKPSDFERIVHLGKHSEELGDIFAAYTEECPTTPNIYLGRKGSEFD